MQNTSIKYHRLTTILERIKAILDEKVADKVLWVKAEISNIKLHRSGHVYIDLIETEDGDTLSQCRATIWRSNYLKIQADLKNDTQNILKSGNEILFSASVNFDKKYGLSLNITGIDMNFALGEIERRRMETIERLTKEGVLNRNKALKAPMVIQRLALIGSESTAGFIDFKMQLLNNPYNYQFHIHEFSCMVQGDKADQAIISQLELSSQQPFDVIVIVRGGGSKMDLDVFNSYNLARKITEMSIPVFTGIGHEIDVGVTDIVANHSFKTPTAVANDIIERAFNFQVRVDTLFSNIREGILSRHKNEKSRIDLLSEQIRHISVRKCELGRGALHQTMTRIISEIRDDIALKHKDQSEIKQRLIQGKDRLITQERNNLLQSKELLELYFIRNINNAKNWVEKTYISIAPYSPENILAKGFVIPRVQGKLYHGQKLLPNTKIVLQFKEHYVTVNYTGINNNITNGKRSIIKRTLLRGSR